MISGRYVSHVASDGSVLFGLNIIIGSQSQSNAVKHCFEKVENVITQERY